MADERMQISLKYFLNWLVSECVWKGIVFTGTNKYIMNWYYTKTGRPISSRQVTRWVSRLVELGYIVSSPCTPKYDKATRSYCTIRNIVIADERLKSIVESERESRGMPRVDIVFQAAPLPSSFFIRGVTLEARKTRFSSNYHYNGFQKIDGANFYRNQKILYNLKEYNESMFALSKLRQIELAYLE
jgi:hypothetical protein